MAGAGEGGLGVADRRQEFGAQDGAHAGETEQDLCQGAGALLPSLRPGQEVVVMDNLSSHKGSRAREVIEERGCKLSCTCPALLPRSQPYRRSVRQAQDTAAESWGTYSRGTHRGDGPSPRGGDGERCSRLLRAPRLPRKGPSAMTDALGVFMAKVPSHEYPPTNVPLEHSRTAEATRSLARGISPQSESTSGALPFPRLRVINNSSMEEREST